MGLGFVWHHKQIRNYPRIFLEPSHPLKQTLHCFLGTSTPNAHLLLSQTDQPGADRMDFNLEVGTPIRLVEKL